MRPHLAPSPASPVEPAQAPTFSVIIAAYQAAATVGEAVASALEQTVPPHEVIVCDDGSTDEIEDALAPYRERITFLRTEHGGEGAAKNAAARAATGEFVVILDADDLYLPDRIEALGELAATRPDLVILTTDAYIEAGGRIVRRVYNDEWTFEIADQRRAILERNFIFGLAAVRRELLLDAGGFDESIGWTTDWDCWLRLIFAGGSAGLVDAPLASYRLHERALSSNRPRMLRGRVQTLQKAARRADLRPEDRTVLSRSIDTYKRAAKLEEAREALIRGSSDARRLAVGVALDGGYAAPTRVKAFAASLAPRIAHGLMRRGARKRWIGAAGISIRRHPRQAG